MSAKLEYVEEGDRNIEVELLHEGFAVLDGRNGLIQGAFSARTSRKGKGTSVTR